MNTSVNASLGTEQEELNGVAESLSYDFPLVPGIDSLYYFISSNKVYVEFYLSIAETVEACKEINGGYVPKDALKITIADMDFVYLGKQEGFYFFADTADLLRVGFKDPTLNLGLKDIRVQLQGTGIYSFGLLPLVEYVNTVLLKDITQPEYYLTRVDLNIFCQCDLGSIINPEYIVTRKRQFSQIIGTKHRYETLYIGKPPCRFRIYDKYMEMKDSKNHMKLHFLYKYLKEHGLKVIEPLWNFEIECHRDFLKQYKINTLDDLFSNVDNLFHKCMGSTRFIDIATISHKDWEAQRHYKAKNHPLWSYLDQSYSFKAYEQAKIPLERLTPIPKEYTVQDFMDEYRALVAKGEKHCISVNQDEMREILHESYLWLSGRAKQMVKPFVPIVLETSDRKYLLTKNHTAVPILPKYLEDQTDEELHILNELLTKALHNELAQRHPDLSLITKHIQPLYIEQHRRRVGQKELDLWQQ